MKKLAFATDIEHTRAEGGERLLCGVLEQRGIDTVFVPWDAGIDWQCFDMVMIRYTWDYHLRLPEFRSWLDQLERLQVPVWNPVPLLRWNTHKHYLLELAAAGVNLPELELLSQGTEADLPAILQRHGWEQAVIKPAVSAGAWQTWVTTPGSLQQDNGRLNMLLQRGDFIIQEFVEEVVRTGEYSFIFFNGAFSHAILKRAKAGDFRVQAVHGGTEAPVVPTHAQLRAVQPVIDQLREPFLYARVDGVFREERFLLMELELIEPCLFLDGNRAAVLRLADAISARLKAAGSSIIV